MLSRMVTVTPETMTSKPFPIKRKFTLNAHGIIHPLDTVSLTPFDVVKKDARGKTIHEEYGIMAPDFWSQESVEIVVMKYFRYSVGDPRRESGVPDLIDRVVGTFAQMYIRMHEGSDEDYDMELVHEYASILYDELYYIVLHQMACWNSPVWFNFGVPDQPQQAHACYILRTEDELIGNEDDQYKLSIADNLKRETAIFMNGSGIGANLSNLRSSVEPLSTGGFASGPISFMKAADYNAAGIKSGGKTRRAARMQILDCDHWDVWLGEDGVGNDFITIKQSAERMAHDMIALGWSNDMDGPVYRSVPMQNTNLSVRVNDAFMAKVAGENPDETWELKNVKDGFTRKVNAKEMFKAIAEAAWSCADPGLQFKDTINKMNTCAASDEIRASNPCSEYFFLDGTACNLASLNWYQIYQYTIGQGQSVSEMITAAQHIIRLFTLTMDSLIDFAHYPDNFIEDNTKKFRTIGLGYGNLGAYLMAQGIPYDSHEGRSRAAALTALLHFTVWETSTELAEHYDPFEEYEKNAEHVESVLQKHTDSLLAISENQVLTGTTAQILESARGAAYASIAKPVRNAQMTNIAPTGTIGFMMGFASTGVEPLLSLVEYKTLSGGGEIVKKPTHVIEEALNAMKDVLPKSVSISTILMAFDEDGEAGMIDLLRKLVKEHSEVPETVLKVFETAFGAHPMHYNAQLMMLAAVQPFLSGGISKTVNMPGYVTPEDVKNLYIQAWKLGLKCIAIYRDGSKAMQAVSTARNLSNGKVWSIPESYDFTKAYRTKMPSKHKSTTFKLEAGAVSGYMTLGYYADGRLGEVFGMVGSQGDTINGLVNAICMTASVALQHGVPVKQITKQWRELQFRPNGIATTNDVKHIRSVLDYMAQIIEKEEGIEDETKKMYTSVALAEAHRTGVFDIRLIDGVPSIRDCPKCGHHMQMITPSCHVCQNCTHNIGGCGA